MRGRPTRRPSFSPLTGSLNSAVCSVRSAAVRSAWSARLVDGHRGAGRDRISLGIAGDRGRCHGQFAHHVSAPATRETGDAAVGLGLLIDCGQ